MEVFVGNRAGALEKVSSIMRKKEDLEIPKQHLKITDRTLVGGLEGQWS